MIECMEGNYTNMRIFQGKKYDYLGKDLDYLVPGEEKFTMVNYLKKVIT